MLHDLYEFFPAEIKSSLLEMALQFRHDNQSLAAKLLNIGRGTLRKKWRNMAF